MAKLFVAACPVCAADLAITQLKCSRCSTRIDTTLTLPPFLHLPVDLQEFVLVFLSSRGNIRDVERRLGVSYPTVCKRLDMVNEFVARAGPVTSGKGREDGERRGSQSRKRGRKAKG